MTCIYLLLIFSLVLIPNLTKAQSNIELFNQKDLSGWYAYEPESGKHENALELFAVDQQMIRLYGNKAGYLMSEQSFDNFQLCVEFRWNTDSTFVRKSNKKNRGRLNRRADWVSQRSSYYISKRKRRNGKNSRNSRAINADAYQSFERIRS